jgi:SAM-dependent methyltransferase
VTKLMPFDKYKYYLNAVQSPETDAEFMLKVYKELRGRGPTVLREDFCGTFAISCEWVKQGAKFKALGVDMDPEPLRYGFENYFEKLEPEEKKRLQIIQSDVLNPALPMADIIAVFNFSNYFFKERETMVSYFENCRNKLNKGGLLIMDCFGGPLCEKPNVDVVKHRGFTYYWDQASFDPITRHARFYIHFKLKNEKKRKRVFQYSWRMWTIAELRDCMTSSGFSKTHVYWEGTNKRGGGNGVFRKREKGEVCDAWIAYVVGEK